MTARRFPFAPYRPGSTPRPDDAHPIYAIAPPSATEPVAWRENEAYLYAIDLCNQGYFWEAHEVWEPIWAQARPNSRERALLQGLIQLANAALKAALGQTRAARRVGDLAVAGFEAARAAEAGRLMGLDIDGCIAAARGLPDGTVHLAVEAAEGRLTS